MNEEFIWNLTVDGESKEFKCVVLDDEVVTYEGDQEHKHLKITEKLKKEHVLQIDTVTSVYGMQVPFQLENGIPYLKLDGKWAMSETSFRARKLKQYEIYKTNSIVQMLIGLVLVLIPLVMKLVTGDWGSWWMLMIFGSIPLATGLMQFIDLKKNVKVEME